MAIEAGRVLSQRYRLIRPVGQGSQASVWVAEHLALTTHVAVKLIDPELAKKESARERFRREATAAAQLRSAHVVQILDHGIDGDQPFIVMELLDGEDLFERLAHRTRLSLRETSKIVTQVARALGRAHAAGIVHRDLKPENVFLCPNEDDEVVKVLDFGVAKVKDAAKVTMQKTGVGTLIGTPHYMSPEQVKGIGEIDYRADLWALGVIAFQCVTGELPYDSEGVGDLLIKITIGEAPIPSQVYPGVNPSFDVWFARACARDPAMRFQSARDMALALAGVVGVIDGVAARAPTVRPSPAAIPALAALATPREMTEELEASEDIYDDDDDDAPTMMKPPSAPPPRPPARLVTSAPAHPTPRTTPQRLPTPAPLSPREPPAPAPPVESHEGHDINFDETDPTARSPLHVSEPPPPISSVAPPSPRAPVSVRAPISARAPISVRDPVAPSAEPPPPPPPPPSNRAPVQGLAGPVAPPAPSFDEVAPVIPRPPPPPRPVPPRSSARPVTRAVAPVLPVATPMEIPVRSTSFTVPPPELDGSRRRRMVRYLLATLMLFAVGLTWMVVRSQIDPSNAVAVPPPPATTAAPPPPPPRSELPPPPKDTATGPAVDPGKVTHPAKPMPSVHKGPLRLRPLKQPTDGTILVPDPDEESPAAP